MRHFVNPYPDYNGSNLAIDSNQIENLIQHYVEQILQNQTYNDGDLYVGTSGKAKP
jgi:hypothetical protein